MAEDVTLNSAVTYEKGVTSGADVTYTHTGKCFERGNQDLPDLQKGAKEQLSVKNDSREILKLTYVVRSAERQDGAPVAIGNVQPFHQMKVMVEPGQTIVLTLRPVMGLGDKGTIIGVLNPEGGCEHVDAGLPSHTEWHIEC